MKYKIGQSVRVKRGILCPDDPDYDLSGWQGRIIDIDEEEEEGGGGGGELLFLC